MKIEIFFNKICIQIKNNYNFSYLEKLDIEKIVFIYLFKLCQLWRCLKKN